MVKQRAAAMVELALLLSLVAIIIIGALLWQGEWVREILENVASAFEGW